MVHRSQPDGFSISLANQHGRHAVNEQQLIDAARLILRDSRFTSGSISLAVVDDLTMHSLNRRYLQHDYPTDVLSFLLCASEGHLEGEVVISADTAAAEALEVGWPATIEQLLYVIHGMLHLVGYRDKSTADKYAMRAAEEKYLRHFGVDQPRQPQSTARRNIPLTSTKRTEGRAAT
jgi:probable rRNA maturation factor